MKHFSSTGSHIYHTWVRSGSRPLAVRVDQPHGGIARGAVVVVPSVGREHMVNFRTLRVLAARAAELGFVACSLSLSGHGDSADFPAGQDPVTVWLDDIAAVTDFAAGLVGDRPVHLVGLRLGAALADQVPLGAAAKKVLWEPIGGDAYLRRHQMLRRLAVPLPKVDSGVECDGYYFTESEAASLGRLALPRPNHDGNRMIRREADRKVARAIGNINPHDVEVPYASIEQILGFLGSDARSAAPMGRWLPQATAALRCGSTMVTETHCRIGPRGLAGILTEPVEVPPSQTVVFTAIGAENKSGPSDTWARAARQLAARGIASVRADRRLIGDSLDVSSPTEPGPYTDDAVADVVAAADFMSDRYGLPITGVGACAGSWCLLRASATADFAQIVSFDNLHWNPDESVFDQAFYDSFYTGDAAVTTLVQAVADDPSDVGEGAAMRFKHRVSGWLRRTNPGLFTLLKHDAEGRVGWLLDRVPERTAVRLLTSAQDYHQFCDLGGPKDLAHARERGLDVSFERMPRLDHSFLSENSRRDAIAKLMELLAVSDARKVAA